MRQHMRGNRLCTRIKSITTKVSKTGYMGGSPLKAIQQLEPVDRKLLQLIIETEIVGKNSPAICPACDRFYRGCMCDGCKEADNQSPGSWNKVLLHPVRV